MRPPAIHNDEEKLVSLLLAKDRAAFESLYDSHSSTIYGILVRILKSEELARDVLQETFLKVWRKIHTYDRSKGRIFTWVLNIARNHAIDVLRSKHYQRTQKATSMEISPSASEDRKAEEMKVEHIGVREIVATLSPELKQIIDCLYFEGFSQSEAAEELGLPLGTVKSRARKAMKVLKKQFV